MGRRILKNRIRLSGRHNAGFTLVELVIVLALMVILLSITITGGLAWQEWSRFQHEDAVAEEMFFAAQNQLMSYDSSDAMQRRVKDALLKDDNSGEYVGNYVLATSHDNSRLEEILYGDSDSGYQWNDIWETFQTSNPGTGKQNATIISLYANANDYDTYLKIRANEVSADSLDKGTVLLFDLISPLVSDVSAMNGAILLEFSPEAGQVFSVCYSDRLDSFVEVGESGVSYLEVATDRRLHARNENLVGYYSADQLYEKLAGRSTSESNVVLEFKNNEVFSMVLSAPTGELETGDALSITVFDGDGGAEKAAAMIFSLDYRDSTSSYEKRMINNYVDACAYPTKIDVMFKKGTYRGSTMSMWIPVWREENAGTESLHFVLDAADVQAQSKTYFMADVDKDADAQAAFRNTYSFYRFGLSDSVNYVWGAVTLSKKSTGEDSTSYSKKRVAIDESHPSGLVSHLDADGLNENGTAGECATFASCDVAPSDKNERTFSIKNGRHFYNIRFETDYKRSALIKNTFLLEADIDWHVFTGVKDDPNVIALPSERINYFMNSYGRTDDTGNPIVAGIDYSGNNVATGAANPSAVDTDTKHLPFPGFRKLDRNDVFTQTAATGTDRYTISNLTISVTANIVYGIYDSVFEDPEIESWFKSVNTGLDLQQVLDDCKDSGDFSGILGISAETEDSKGSNPARAGLLPVGLFAENHGEISNIILDCHVVRGMESLDGTNIVYTCMAGGFAGNNMGTVKNLALLDSADPASTMAVPDNQTRVNGRTDVGGIIGRQSYSALKNKQVELQDLRNEGTVTGYENVGGIVGRAYVHFVNDEDNTDMRDGRLTDAVRKAAYHDGYYMTDTKKSMTGDTVYRTKTVTLTDCVNEGHVSGDPLIYGGEDHGTSYMLDGANVLVEANDIHCAFIGGIAGCLQDGCICDNSTAQTNPLSGYFQYGYYSGDFSYVTLQNCSSSILYSQDDIDAVDFSETSSETRDCYVGGLVGYARLAGIVNCNGVKDGEEVFADGNTEFPVVYGRKYVGGLIGCSDECVFSDPSQSGDYFASNEKLVIGEKFVGGIAGAFGVGASDPLTLSFRNPAENECSHPSVVYKTDRKDFIKNLLNAGIVLGWSSDKAFDDEDASGVVGGIVGAGYASMQEVDNIQSEDTRNYLLKMVGFSDPGQIADMSAEEVYSISSESKYGGCFVGGIAGMLGENMHLNRAKDSGDRTGSDVNAIIFGQDYVGGGIGCIGVFDSAEDQASIFNIYPVTDDQSSETNAMIVIGRDAVGGIAGRIDGTLNDPLDNGRNRDDARKIDVPYAVYGRYGVGGVCGYLPAGSAEHVPALQVNIQVTGDDRPVVSGIAYAGGYVGVSETADSQISGTIENVEVNAKDFAGGYYGAMINATSIARMATYTPNLSKTDVNADIFAGGLAGLYVVMDDSAKMFSEINDSGEYEGTLHGIASGWLEKTDGYKTAAEVFTGLVAADINRTGTSAFMAKAGADISIDFSEFSVGSTINIRSGIFAGGLFGYVPERFDARFLNYTNRGNVYTSSSVSSSPDRGGVTGEKYSYLGGMIGRIPTGITLRMCRNLSKGDYSNTAESYYSAKEATYLGGLAEVNAGLITGESETSLCTNTVERTSTAYRTGGFVGINIGNIENCSNTAVIGTESTPMAASIAAVSCGGSIIINCTNSGRIRASGVAAGISAVTSGSTISNCRNTSMVQATSGIAGGIAGRNTGAGLVILNCANEGTVDAVTKSAGILCENTNTSEQAYLISKAVNKGSVTIEGGASEEKTAGIIFTPGGVGRITICRNYGKNLKYAISAGRASEITYCFDATSAEDHFGDVSTGGDKYANFYVGDEPAHSYGFSAKRGYYTTAYINKVGFENLKLIMTVGDMMESDILGIDDLVFSPGNAAEEHKENSSWDWIKSNKKLTYEIVANEDGVPDGMAFDGFSILWDNIYDDAGPEGVDVEYNIIMYSHNNAKITIAPMTVNIKDAPVRENFSMLEMTFVQNKKAVINGVEYAVSKDEMFNEKDVMKIQIIVTACSSDSKKVGVRTFGWQEKIGEEYSVMPAVEGQTVDPYKGSNGIDGSMELITGDDPEAESLLYPIEKDVNQYTLVLHGYETPISNLEHNPKRYEAIPSESDRKRYVEDLDAQYMDFILRYAEP